MRKTQRVAQRRMLTDLLHDFLRRTAQTYRGNLEAVHDQLRLINALARQIASVTPRTQVRETECRPDRSMVRTKSSAGM
jgi:hypothetical protein